MSLDCYSMIDGQKDVVFKIVWQLLGADGALYSAIPATTEVPYIAGQPFTPFNQLTEAEVIAWIDQYTSPEQIAYWELAIAENIEKQRDIVAPPLPWVEVPVVQEPAPQDPVPPSASN